MVRHNKGHAALEYMLVVAVLVLALAAGRWDLGKPFVRWYHDLASRVAKP